MTQDEILEMARQAGFLYGTMGPSNARFVTAIGHTFIVELETFAKLVAAKEREACAKRCEELEKAWVNAGLWKVTHEYKECSAAIRARGEA
jgi:hypothetical protein